MRLHRLALLALLVAAAVLLRAGHAAGLTMSWVPQLISHVHTCWTPPKNITVVDDLEARIGVKLNPDGTLAGEPSIVEVTKHPHSKAFTDSVVRAIKRCQPYSFLPADEYKGGWDKLDMTFTTDAAMRAPDRPKSSLTSPFDAQKLHQLLERRLQEHRKKGDTK